MIVYDTSALLDAASYGPALDLLDQTDQPPITILIPAAALADAFRLAGPGQDALLREFHHLSEVVLNPLDGRTAMETGRLAQQLGLTDLGAAHAAQCALDRGWPVLTRHAAQWARLAPDVRVAEIPDRPETP